MQENKLPPGYVPLTHHSLSGYSSGNGDSRNQRPRSGGSSDGNGRSRGTNNQGRGGQQRRRGSRPRSGGKPMGGQSPDE